MFVGLKKTFTPADKTCVSKSCSVGLTISFPTDDLRIQCALFCLLPAFPAFKGNANKNGPQEKPRAELGIELD